MHASTPLPVRPPIAAPAPIRRPGQDRPCLLARWISLLLLLVSYHAAHGATLVAEDSEWRYFKGFTEASTPDTTAWRRSDFNDTTWSKGLGPFYYEDDVGYSGHTSLSDMRRNYSSVFLRNVFKLTNAASVQGLVLNVHVDDGAVIWLNGSEIARINMAAGEPVYNGTALGSAGEPVISTVEISNSTSILKEGSNVLAVEAFNNSLSDSTDFLIAVSLTGNLDALAPVVETTVPPAGAIVRSLTSVEVIFSENVTGVDAADLLINGTPATSLAVISPRDYTFTFPSPSTGSVRFAWIASTGIKDLATPPNLFAGGSWSCTLDPNAPLADVVISEFLADNASGKRDDQGNRSDWIELYNRSAIPAELDGWFLTDERNNLTKWRFPAVTIAPKSYLLVWASNQNHTDPSAPLHTNFKLSSDGEYLGLVTPKTNIVSEFAPVYPPQQPDVSYGRDLASPDLAGYYAVTTPGAANSTRGAGFAPDVVVSPRGGVYTNATLTVTMSAPAGIIRYTTDGTKPTASSARYTGPFTIAQSTPLQARVFQDNLLPSPINVEVYTLLDNSSAGFSSNLPLLVLHTAGQGIGAEARTPSFVTVMEPVMGRTTLRTPPSFMGNCQIELRGQSSLGFPKVAYNLEINDANGNDLSVPLLGLPSESDWVLYNPYSDKPFLQNFLAYELYNQMGHYAPRCRFVEVFVDTSAAFQNRLDAYGDYVGIYLLVEKIKLSNHRMDLARLSPEMKTEPEISGGYMFKKDKDSPDDLNFSTEGGNGFSAQALKIHEPKPREITSAQMLWLKNYLIQFERALYSANWLTATGTNHYSAYIDVDSFVDFHWIVEFPKQIDGYRLSNYMSKDRGGKVMLAPIWDWNLSFGNADYLDGASTSGYYYSLIDENSHIWLRRLMCGTADANGTSGDPDFNQKIADRWSVLRTNIFSPARLLARIDEMAAYLNEAQARDFARWPRLGVYVWPNPPLYSTPTTYQGIIANLKYWVSARFDWIDGQFLKIPEFNRADSAVSPGFPITLSAPIGAIYYTIDGSDPRLPGGGISPRAQLYTRPIVLQSTGRIVARARNGSRWSGPAAATFTVTLPSLVLTELMYSPARTPGSLTNDASSFEYLELLNAGSQTVDLTGCHFTSGIQYTFAAPGPIALPPGQRLVLARDPSAFTQRYGRVTMLAGPYVGSLDNQGERLILQGPMQEIILDVSYSPNWYPATDGLGFALVPATETPWPDNAHQAAGWRPGARDGTPGQAEPAPLSFPSIVVNEVLTHTDPPLTGSIELYNAGSSEADIGGWYLSDDRLTPKYRIAAGTHLAAGAYRVFTEADFNPVPGVPPSFNLRASGDEVFLFSANASGLLTGYLQGTSFGAALNGVSFGRHQTGTGDIDFVSQATRTLGQTNGPPSVGPVVISEIMYHPSDVVFGGTGFDDTEHEYIELRNISSVTVFLFDPNAPTNSWRLRKGVDFTFPPVQSLNPNDRVLVVSFDPVAEPGRASSFRGFYSLNESVRLFGPWQGKLANGDDTLELIQPDQVRFYVTNTVTTSVVIDQVHYRDASPWPAGADGFGFSLQRKVDSAYGNDPSNWVAAPPTPGQPLAAGTEPSIQTAPVGQSVDPGATVVFNVTASGPSLSYQWRRNREWIPGATQNTLTLTNVQPGQSGDYDVVVSSASRSIVSIPAPLQVAAAPFIQQVPASQEVQLGATAQFKVIAAGLAPMRYQWRHNGLPIPQATSPTLTLANVGVAARGSYDVVLTDIAGRPATSPAATLTVLVDPNLDSDGDGMPDGYELDHGLDPSSSADALTDADGDGASNLAEYRAGTDPQDAASVLKIDQVDLTAGVTLHFRCLDNRSYSLLSRDEVPGADWQSLSNIAALPEGTGGTRSVHIVDPRGPGPQRFYRLVTPAVGGP